MSDSRLKVKERAEGYYDTFPGKSMNVAVTQVPLNDPKVPLIEGKPVKKNILVATKDFAEGEVIYKEQPIVSSLDTDLEGKGTHCSNCLRQLPETSSSIRPEGDPLGVAYCSKECELQAASEHHTLLFGKGAALDDDAAPSEEDDALKTAVRVGAHEHLVDHMRRSEKLGSILVARFIGRMVAEQTKKMAASSGAAIGTLSDDYSLFDHLERLRFLEIPDADWNEQAKILEVVLKLAADGLEEFLKNDRYGVLLGKMAYNAIGVTFADGRSDKPEPTARPEDRERTRTPHGTMKQTGAGLYFVSSYMSHSCDPSVQPTFPTGTSELHLVANKAIKKGDELTMAYVDINPAEDPVEGRRLRRQEIARGWRFACSCLRCQEGAPKVEETSQKEDDEVKIEGKGAQVDEAVHKFENGIPSVAEQPDRGDVE